MKTLGEIIVIEDDEDDIQFLKEILESLNYPNKVVFFQDSTLVVDYLLDNEVKPFLILCDINMPRLNGYQLRHLIQINEDLNLKCFPFVFLTTSKDHKEVMKAYKFSIQGFFPKGCHFDEYKETIGKIIEYWKNSLTPTKYL